MYNSTGRSILASYNDEDMYTFNITTGKREYHYIEKEIFWKKHFYRSFLCIIHYSEDHCFKGHRNSATVKGCSWFTDDFVLSGSDDGYIYGWDKESEHIVMSLYADENGVVSLSIPSIDPKTYDFS